MRFFYFVIVLLALSSFAFASDEKKNYDKAEAYRISKVCAGCHGMNGAAPGHSIPIIGGQKSSYVEKTMVEFRDGKRYGTVMKKIALAYDDSRAKLVGEYFADQKWVNTREKVDKSLILLGKKLSKECADCHGKNGKGDEGNPRIAGQHPLYLEHALYEYKEGKRGDVSEMDLIKNMTDKQIKALAAYFASIK
ncbi:MAG: c-type cytochrome [Calditerrivibrio sp.]|nr:c-type cytochrome [Calditerrivibrio sp.]MCA1980578.1 c-type cytochrome [Calditerrivibrio sp.]